MRTATALSVIAGAFVLSPVSVSAFRDTSPFLLWNTDPSQIFDDASKVIGGSSLVAADEVYGKLSTLGCDWENVVVINVDQLHNSHLPTLPSSHPTNDALIHIPYLTKPTRRGLSTGLESWASNCGAEVVSSFDDVEIGEKFVIALDSSADSLPSIPSTLSEPYIVLLTGSLSSSSAEKRQERPFPTHITESATATATETESATATETGSATSTATATDSPTETPRRNSTIPTGGPLLERVQLLTTPIITSLLITFGLFIPIATFGVMMLTSIQVPPRMMEISKGLVVGKERKDQ
ncbi:hypothetical protein I316_00433 [Kwoniella heveanensis BCC8398]|uniref:Protein BIG1 n=1 Tax=Kwoniella heveanensis BCC8398 TaxID=1296120 RepID=A0A1B9H4M9_9TREE|nr:hypothetical protein I316_00433 [Kwoniella heveanensis BCC8398]